MKIIELIQKYHFENVWSEFVKFYGEEEGIHVTDESQQLYKKVYDALIEMKPELFSDGLISITEIAESEFSDRYIDIYGLYPDDQNVKHAIEFIEWNEVISMEYLPGANLSGETYTDEEFLAALIYEITFCGFDQESIREEHDKIKNKVEEIGESTNTL